MLWGFVRMYNLLWLLFICNPACWSSSTSVVLFFNWLEHENVTVLCRFYSFFSKFTGHLLFFVFCFLFLVFIISVYVCYWYLVDRGQGCCKISHNKHDSSTTKNYLAHMLRVLKVRNSASELCLWMIWIPWSNTHEWMCKNDSDEV